MRDYKHNDILVLRGRKYIAKDVSQEPGRGQGFDPCHNCAFGKKQGCQFIRLYGRLYPPCWKGRDFYFKRHNEKN
jgi:hypothetical protein